MSSNNNVLANGLTFIQNLGTIPNSYQYLAPASAATTWANTIGDTSINITNTANNAKFAALNQSNMPTDLESFVNYITGTTTATGTGKTLAQELLKDYVKQLQIGTITTGGLQLTGDWSVLTSLSTTSHPPDENPVPVLGDVASATDLDNLTGPPPIPPRKGDTIVGQFNAWFSRFLANYPFNSTGLPITTATDFFTKAAQDLTVIAALQESTTTPTPNPSVKIASYQQVYDGFFHPPVVPGHPTVPDQGFIDMLKKFYSEQLKKNGYFNPSQAFADWTSEVLQSYSLQKLGTNVFAPSSLQSGDFEKPIILNKIFELIAALIGTMQNIASAQANRLLILTQWQQAYTDSISQLHVFLVGDGTILGSGDTGTGPTSVSTLRGQLNDEMNATLRTQMQSNQSAIGDDAKALQSNLNQTTDAVSQQANAANAIIQNLYDILGFLGRG